MNVIDLFHGDHQQSTVTVANPNLNPWEASSNRKRKKMFKPVDMNTESFSTYRVAGNHQCFMYVDINGLIGYQSYPLLIFAGLLASACLFVYLHLVSQFGRQKSDKFAGA